MVFVVSALLVPTGLLSPVSRADGPVVIGGGAAIEVNGTPCTLTTIGTDQAGDVVGFTSASCGGPGSPVAAGWAPGTLGTVAVVDPDLDYAVITFDKSRVAPTADFAGFAINGIGPDATPGQQACKDSRETGVACAPVSFAPGADPDTVLMHACGNAGDSGASVTVNDLLVGMIRGDFPPPGRCPLRIWTRKFAVRRIPQRDKPEITSIIGDVNAKGGPRCRVRPVAGLTGTRGARPPQQKRLHTDVVHGSVEIRTQQSRQFPTRLIDDMRTCSRRPVVARIVLLRAMPPGSSPRHRLTEQIGGREAPARPGSPCYGRKPPRQRSVHHRTRLDHLISRTGSSRIPGRRLSRSLHICGVDAAELANMRCLRTDTQVTLWILTPGCMCRSR
jgi:hypothetical protein